MIMMMMIIIIIIIIQAYTLFTNYVRFSYSVGRNTLMNSP